MGNNYRKIEFDIEGDYGSTEKDWIYIKSNRTCDAVTIYNKNYNELFSFTEWGDFDMGCAIVIALTDWDNGKMKHLTIDEINKLKS